ncbi:hypothetical protein V6N13_026060 [Hibiscus sabdariffa]
MGNGICIGFEECFRRRALPRIMAIMPYCLRFGADRIGWKDDLKRIFTLKSAYLKILCEPGAAIAWMKLRNSNTVVDGLATLMRGQPLGEVSFLVPPPVVREAVDRKGMLLSHLHVD